MNKQNDSAEQKTGQKIFRAAMDFAVGILKKCFWIILRIILLITGVWVLAAMPVVLKIAAWQIQLFSAALIVLLIAGFRKKSLHFAALILEASFFFYFISLTPQEQFENVEFRRVFAVKPSINYLEDGRFEVVDLRKNRYPENYDEGSPYDDVFVNEVFDPALVESMQVAMVYWDGMYYAAHTMLNFKFSDGRELAVSVEPRTPVGVDRQPFTCLCKQQELLFILSDPADLFDLRSRVRGEDMYIFETNFTPLECRAILSGIISKTHDLYYEPEFYDLIKANCITALLPYFRNARPDLQWDGRVLFNGFFDRLLFDQGVLLCRPGESFESLKSRSFIKGKSQGKL